MNAFRVYFKDEIEVCIWWGVFFNVLLNLFYKCFIDTFSPMFVKESNLWISILLCPYLVLISE